MSGEEELIVRTIPPKPWRDGEVEMVRNGLVRYRTMTREELMRTFPRPVPKPIGGQHE